MARPVEELVEFDRLREMLARLATCAPGRRAVVRLAFSTDRTALETVFALLGEAIAYLRTGGELGFGALADPEGWLGRLARPAGPAGVLEPGELLDAANLAETSGATRQHLDKEADRYPRLAARLALVPDLRPVAARIRRAILPSGGISDDASLRLRRIRQAAVESRERLHGVLRQVLAARGQEPDQQYITIRNARFVIPVRAELRGAVPGVVHGASASGQTLFVEPLEAIEGNNRLVELAEEEAEEIARILEELTGELRLHRAECEAAAAAIAELDSLFARARFAREFACAIPQFNQDSRLRLEAARHPVLEENLCRQGRAIVPISLAIGGEETVLVISGPNTGGKTVALKTVGLAALAAQAAIPVAAERAELPLLDRVLADIGDEQSIAADLSTFSARVLNLRAMLAGATEHSLVLADELGTGTAPEEGAALAVALLEEFRSRRCLTLSTTHHDRLKAYASTTPGILNAAVEFDEATLRPTYRLLVGVPGVSSGIEIAGRLGLPARAIERARAELTPAAREARDLLAYLHRSRAELEEMKRQAADELARLEEERRRLRTEWVERQQRRLAELEKKFGEAAARLECQVHALVAEIRERDERARLEKQAMRRMAKIRAEAREETDAAVLEQLAASQEDLGAAPEAFGRPARQEELQPGARVRVRGLPKPVVVRRRDAQAVEVQAGPLRMRVPLEEVLAMVDEPPEPSEARPAAAITVHAAPGEEPSADELNVIGCTVEEASRRADKFLDAAALAGKPRVRIIHGYGTGALRRGLAAFLAAHPLVEKIQAEDLERGGEAVTVVTLRG
jgi:DNA mismatch repair protein MutS2